MGWGFLLEKMSGVWTSVCWLQNMGTAKHYGVKCFQYTSGNMLYYRKNEEG